MKSFCIRPAAAIKGYVQEADINDSLVKQIFVVLDIIEKNGLKSEMDRAGFQIRSGRITGLRRGDRLPSDNIIVGLDIGTTKICAVIGEYNENGETRNYRNRQQLLQQGSGRALL